MKMRHTISRVGVLALGVMLSVPVSATVFSLQAAIDGAQANAGAGTGSPATGSASMLFDDLTNLFSWNITWTGLTAPITVAHFHGPALPNQNAGVEVNFGAISGLTSPSIGSAAITNPQATDLLNDLWYINIHSQNSPGGEIRGQVLVTSQVPEPITLAMVIIGLASIGFARKKNQD